MKSKVPFILPGFPKPEDITQDISAIISSNWYTNFGPFERKFRDEISKYLGGSHVCTTSNATQSLDIAITGLFEKPGAANRVITQSFTFAAAAERLIANGFTPVFIDIDDNLQPDIQQAKEYLKANHSTTAGMLIANTFGVGNPNITEWEELAGDFNLPLIIDSAAGLGSVYNQGEKIGLRGDCEVFSLHATKPFAVGEGGLIVSGNKEFIEICREISNFGFGPNREVHRIGTNAKLQELNCAIGLRQLENYDKKLDSRRRTLSEYKKRLIAAGYSFQPNDEASTVPFVTAIAPSSKIADEAIVRLHENSVEARRYYTPLHMQKQLAKYCEVPVKLTKTEDIASRVISLPVHDNMEDDAINQVTAPLADII
jgi:dTDP-4-amino-4,6-dideoxygalactose transaminase